NYTLGIKEQIIFPQIVYDNVKRVRGFDITFVISTDDKKMSYYLLKSLGAPFQKVKEDN
ncbi:MAG: 50S ribosomal protein L5, partial [Ureaplasma sp.]|nr:50S ribosomal protein L5 [Ureaplasma sp.]